MRNNREGQTLIGVLISLAILLILAQALFTLINTSYQFVGFNRSRIAARHLAQERIELIRNLPYDDIGTVGGIPSGTLPQEESVVQNGLSYTIRTSIVYIDDEFDGQAPDDLLPVDYKRARVEVSWGGITPSRNGPIVLTTDIAPQGIETTEGGGTLSILVFDANALPVAQADVRIEAGSLDPAIDLELQTNDNGRIILPGTPICTDCYTITVTKEGYSSDKTYSTAEVANPAKPLQSIIEGEVTEISFAIDRVSSIALSTFNDRETGFTPRPSTQLIVRGEKSIGTDIDDLPVYKYSENIITDTNGEFLLESLEWDNYHVEFFDADSITFAGSNPAVPLAVLPNTEYTLSVTTSTKTPHSYLGYITNGADPIASASATLRNLPDYTEKKFTGIENDPDYGYVFFSDLETAVYDLIATASGYVDFSGTTSISGNKTETTTLTPE